MQNFSFFTCALIALLILTVRRSRSDNDDGDQEAENNDNGNDSKTKSKLLSRQGPVTELPNTPPTNTNTDKTVGQTDPNNGITENPVEGTPPTNTNTDKTVGQTDPNNGITENPVEGTPPTNTNTDKTVGQTDPNNGITENPVEGTPPTNTNTDKTVGQTDPNNGITENPVEGTPPTNTNTDKTVGQTDPNNGITENPVEGTPPTNTNTDKTVGQTDPEKPITEKPVGETPATEPVTQPSTRKPLPPNDKPPSQPNILLIVADDLGWDDVSYHGSKQIFTPNIDALATNGVMLENYYVEPLCTPSRSALLTGRQPSRIGMQHFVIKAGSPFGVPIENKLLPSYLKELGYNTHLIGKWHIGSHKWKYWPTRRGFDTFFGYVYGGNDYVQHTHRGEIGGFDFWANEFLVAQRYYGNYSTLLFQSRAEDIIWEEAANQLKGEETKKPFFMMFSPESVHTGNKFDQFQYPEGYLEKFPKISDKPRREFAAMIKCLDDAVGVVVKALIDTHLIDNTVIAFTTDNGGVAYGTVNTNVEDGRGSNWPLRGGKGNFWEGGIKGTGFVYARKHIDESVKGTVNNDLMHVTDWLPTLYKIAGGPRELSLDGEDQWESIRKSGVKPARNKLILVHDVERVAYKKLYKEGHWKLVSGPTLWGQKNDQWYQPPNRDTENSHNLMDLPCIVCDPLGIAVDYNKIKPVNCHGKEKTPKPCDPKARACLFDLLKDPCEYENLADVRTDIVEELWVDINDYGRTAVKPLFRAKDPECNPSYPAYAWWPCKEPRYMAMANYIIPEPKESNQQ